MRALALAILTLTACSPRLASAPSARPSAPPPAMSAPLAASAASGPASSVDAYVTDALGPVAGVDVALVSLPDGRCPCAAPFDTSGYGNEMPACACPEALAKWQTRLATCQPSPAVKTITTNARGLAALSPMPGVTGIEVARPGGVRWQPWPSTTGAVSLELAPSISPRVTFAGATGVAVHGAFLFDDGHCVPLDRRGDAWGPRVPLPHYERSSGTLVVEAAGYATVVYSLFDQEEISIDLHHERVATGTCEDGGTARLDNPFQHLVAKLDKKKQFSFKGALDIASTVSCWETANDMSEEWEFTHEDGLVDGGVVSFSGYGGSCTDVKVVDESNRPVADAQISATYDRGGGMSTGTGAQTDKHGIACIDDMSAGVELSVKPPGALGGQCAGDVQVKLEQRQLASPPVVVRLRIAKLPMARPRGRLVNAERAPVANAYVGVRDVTPSSTPDCSDGGEASVTTAADGSFALPLHPRGTLSLAIQHDWYAEQELTIKNDGSAHDIVLQRGDRWTGRVLDPDGKPINECSLFLRLANQRLLTAKCTPSGFTFGTLTPGDAEIQVRIEKHALGTFRTMRRKIHIDAGKPLTLDLAVPRGENITGRIVDGSGHAIPNARLTALPKGTKPLYNRFHDDEIMLEADATGHFALLHLTPGTWSITADRRTGREKTFEVATGTKDIDLVIPDPPRRSP